MHRLLPPLLFAPLLIVSIVIGLTVPLLGPMTWALRWTGIVVIGVGLWLNLGGAGLFGRLGTNIKTFDDPGRLVTDGPFRFTRNPMYLGFTLLLVGTALLIGTLSAWIGAVAFFLAAHFWYVRFEERRMAATFGEAYDRYRTQVPRWVGPTRRTT